MTCSISAGIRTIVVLAGAGLIGAAVPADTPPDGPSLQAASGVTALSGQVVDLDGHGLPGVEFSVGAATGRSAEDGRFLLTYIIPGQTVLQIDGRHAGSKRDTDYGFYEVRVEAKPGRTTVLPFKSWLPRIDHTHEVTLTSPTRSEVVVSTPEIPNFELRIAKGVVVRDVDGRVVTRIGITPIPIDRTPFPLPKLLDLPVYFTFQPGAACLYDASGGIGTARIFYPNFGKELPRARATFWRYEPDANGWSPHGTGTVSSDGRQVIPDQGVVITDLQSAECDPKTRTRQPMPEKPHFHPNRAGKP